MSADLSRAVSHALRHEPWAYELEPDDEGWVDLPTLVQALRQDRWPSLTTQDVEVMVATAAKQRHEVVGGRIRARYGHSTPGRISHVAAAPPVQLFHGTSPEAARAIGRHGLRPMARQYVHLSVDLATARAVGERKSDDPTLLVVAARAAFDHGIVFYTGNEKVWLADEVPAAFLRTLPPPGPAAG